MYMSYHPILLAGLVQSVRAVAMGDLAVQFNAATPTNVDGVMVNGKLLDTLYLRLTLTHQSCSHRKQQSLGQSGH